MRYDCFIELVIKKLNIISVYKFNTQKLGRQAFDAIL